MTQTVSKCPFAAGSPRNALAGAESNAAWWPTQLNLKLLQQNPQVVPPSLNVTEAAADLVAFDQIGTFLLRLTRLSERAEDTSTALGSDLMSFALEGYGLLKVSGKNQGLEDLRRDLGARFARGAARTTPEPATA